MNENRSFPPLGFLQPQFGGSERLEGWKNKFLAIAVRLFLVAAGSFVHSGVFAQTLDWAKQTGGSGHDSANSIVLDVWGNVYLTGSYQDTVDFDPGPGVVEVTSNGQQDIFIQKLDSSGNYIWGKSITGTADAFGYGIDAKRSVLITGYYEGTADFDPDTGTVNMVSNGGSEAFVLCLDTDGNYLWANSIGGTG